MTTETENVATAKRYLAGGEMRARFGLFLQFRDGKIARQHNYDCFEAF